MNMELFRFFNNRTLESIKGQRRAPSYKAKVEQFLQDMRTAPQSSSRRSPEHHSTEVEDPFVAYFNEIQPLATEGFNIDKLNQLCSKAKQTPKPNLLTEVALYLKETLPGKPRTRSNDEHQAKTTQGIKLSKKKQRRADYARVQDLWRKDPSACGKRVLDDKLSQEPSIPREMMEPFWRTVFTKENQNAPDLPDAPTTHERLWAPITSRETKTAYPPRNTAVGPDGLSVRLLRSMPVDALVRIFNIILWCGELPEHLCASRTVLIPKVKNATKPGEFRPITVSSVLVRTLHKVLANRLKRVEIDKRQKAFRECDGCAENTILLDLALKYHWSKHKKMSMAILDMAKAFDSVTFPSLIKTLTAKGIPQSMIDYISKLYHKSNTVLQHGNWESRKIHFTCGVKQGDPLSPLLFNFLVDEMMKTLAPEIGVDIDGLKLNIIAFADDLILLASTETGLQTLINQVTSYLSTIGLEANAGKCATLSIKTVPKQKKSAIDANCRFKINGTWMPTLQRTDEFKYLGVQFNPVGRIKLDSIEVLKQQLDRLTQAPMKPQQRLWILRTILIPRIMYKLVLGYATFGYLKKLDRVVRLYVRKWLHLPHDTPNAYFHASHKDGGLGISSLRWHAPAYRVQRLEAILKTNNIAGPAAGEYLEKEISKSVRKIKESNETLKTSEMIDQFWARQLYKSNDGASLAESRKIPQQHQWVKEGTRFLCGKDFVNCCKARINALSTLSRTARGRIKDRNCRGGCGRIENLNHVLQHCHRTHKARIDRHSAVVNYVSRNLKKLEYTTDCEPKFNTQGGLRKPDMIATMGKTSLVLDAQIVNDKHDLDRANKTKVDYYKNNDSLTDLIKARYGSDTVLVLGITSCDELRSRGVVRAKDIKILSSRVPIGALAGFNMFNRTTSVTPKKRGIG